MRFIYPLRRSWVFGIATLAVLVGVATLIRYQFISRDQTIQLPPSVVVAPETSCGPVSLSLTSQWLDISVPLESIARSCHATDSGVASLADLKQAAESMGLAAEGVRLSANRPLDWTLPMIVHLPNHFAAVLPIDGDHLVFADPPNPPRILTLSLLEARWDGRALLLAKSRRELDRALRSAGLLASRTNHVEP